MHLQGTCHIIIITFQRYLFISIMASLNIYIQYIKLESFAGLPGVPRSSGHLLIGPKYWAESNLDWVFDANP